MFEELDGIEKLRKIVVQEKSSLEILLKKSQEVISKYENPVAQMCKDFGYLEAIRFDLIYSFIYADVVSLPIFKGQDIQSFLHITGNNDKYNDIQKAIVGLYSGTLLHLLTERNEEQGKRTIIHIKDITFDYLFCNLKKADTIILENCTGKYILGEAARTTNSLIRNIYVKNIIGNEILPSLNEILSSMGDGGRISNLVVENQSPKVSYAYNTFFNIGSSAIDLFVKVGLFGDKIHRELSSSELGEINYSIGLYIEKTALNKSKSKYNAFRISSGKMRLFTQYNHSLNTTLLEDIYTLAETLSTKKPREIMATLDEMTVLYENVRDLD